MKLTIDLLKKEAINFCKRESNISHEELVGITDGKAVGTYIEHKFEEYIKNKYEVTIGSSAKGIDLPDENINTDIKVTSITKPQSSSPFKNLEQKIYGLGHNLLIFIYEKTDYNDKCYIDFKNCIFLKSENTGDYNLTKALRELNDYTFTEEEIMKILKKTNIPGDTQTLKNLAKKIILNPPQQGYLTISNAFQWRLRYNNLIHLENRTDEIYSNEKNTNETKTPLYLTDSIFEYLKNDLKILPDIIIEPIFKTDNFLKSANKIFPNATFFRKNNNQQHSDKTYTSTFEFKMNDENRNLELDTLDKEKSYLIIENCTQIKNVESFKFSDKIIEKIKMIKNNNATLTLLCTNIFSRDIFIDLIKNNVPYSFINQLNFNFSIDKNNDICLLIIQFGGKALINKICEVSEISNPSKVIRKFGFVKNLFYLDIDNITKIDGKCPVEWKNGIKHDCSKIMELTQENKQLFNKNNEKVFIENTLLYPFLKGSQLKEPIINKTSKYTIVTQEKIKQDTNSMKNYAPKTWQYLQEHEEYFEKRKSAIYKNTPKFSIFGIGKYSFKKFKVAIYGFNKKPIFSLVYHEKPVMLDDTCYYLPFDDYDEAYLTMLILNSSLVRKFLKNIVFLDSKRPFSKKILKRLDIGKCLKYLSFSDLTETEKKLGLDNYISLKKFREYEKKYIEKKV